MCVCVLKYLHGDDRFLIPASAPQDQSKEREKHKEAHHERRKIAPPREPPAAAVLIQKPLFFYRVELLPLLLRLPVVVVAPGAVARLLRTRFERAGVPGGGGVPGVAARRAHRAEDRRGVEGVGRLLAVVGVPGRALHVVNRPVRRRRRQTRHLRISLGVMRRHFPVSVDWDFDCREIERRENCVTQ